MHAPRAQFLKELGLSEENQGVFNGSWGGSGEPITSYSPTTGKPIASVTTCTREEYDATIAAMDEAFKVFAKVRLPCPAAVCMHARVVACAVLRWASALQRSGVVVV